MISKIFRLKSMKNNFPLLAILFLSVLISFSACEDNFDEPPGPDVNVNANIKMLKDLYLGAPVEITEEWDIEAYVTADDRSGNFFRKVVIEDETAAIELIIDNVELYTRLPAGRKVFVKTKGLWVGAYNNLIQLAASGDGDGIPEAIFNDVVFTTNEIITPTPTIKTITELTSDDLSKLIQISGVQLTSSGLNQTFADAANTTSINHNIEDCDDNRIILRTSGFADFASAPTPSGNGTLTAIYSVFGSDQQLFMRDLNDISFEGDRCGFGGSGLTSLSEDFESLGNNANVDVSGWFNIATKGTRTWLAKEFDDNIYAQGTAFNDSNPEMETWLISPGMDLSSVSTLTFESAQAFYTHDGLSVWISTNFNGDPLSADWTELDCDLAGASSADHDWIPSGPVDLTGFSGKGFIAFKYNGNNVSETASFRVDNIEIN
jgi:hypothetical protein